MSTTNGGNRTIEATATNLAQLGLDAAAQQRVQRAIEDAVQREINQAGTDVTGYMMELEVGITVKVKLPDPKPTGT